MYLIFVQLAVEEEDVLKEAFFAPSDKEGATLQALFEAFSSAAELNPEPGQEAEEPQGAGGLVFDHGRYGCPFWLYLTAGDLGYEKGENVRCTMDKAEHPLVFSFRCDDHHGAGITFKFRRC